MVDRSAQVRITGLNEVRRSLRKAQSQVDDEALREANKVVSDLVANQAKANINSRSGTLAKHTVSAPTKRLAQVKSGHKTLAPYAGVNHYLHESMYVIRAIKNKYKKIRKQYEDSVSKILRRI